MATMQHTSSSGTSPATATISFGAPAKTAPAPAVGTAATTAATASGGAATTTGATDDWKGLPILPGVLACPQGTAGDAIDDRVVDPNMALEQCGDWGFFVELLGDLLEAEAKDVGNLQAAINAGDHKAFREAAHAIKGAAMNLHLPSLVTAAKAAELLGKHLERGPNPRWNDSYPSWRQPYVDLITKEFGRVREFVPTAQQWAEEGEEPIDD